MSDSKEPIIITVPVVSSSSSSTPTDDEDELRVYEMQKKIKLQELDMINARIQRVTARMPPKVAQPAEIHPVNHYTDTELATLKLHRATVSDLPIEMAGQVIEEAIRAAYPKRSGPILVPSLSSSVVKQLELKPDTKRSSGEWDGLLTPIGRKALLQRLEANISTITHNMAFGGISQAGIPKDAWDKMEAVPLSIPQSVPIKEEVERKEHPFKLEIKGPAVPPVEVTLCVDATEKRVYMISHLGSNHYVIPAFDNPSIDSLPALVRLHYRIVKNKYGPDTIVHQYMYNHSKRKYRNKKLNGELKYTMGWICFDCSSDLIKEAEQIYNALKFSNLVDDGFASPVEIGHKLALLLSLEPSVKRRILEEAPSASVVIGKPEKKKKKPSPAKIHGVYIYASEYDASIYCVARYGPTTILMPSIAKDKPICLLEKLKQQHEYGLGLTDEDVPWYICIELKDNDKKHYEDGLSYMTTIRCITSADRASAVDHIVKLYKTSMACGHINTSLVDGGTDIDVELGYKLAYYLSHPLMQLMD
jgi:hypothetical protein